MNPWSIALALGLGLASLPTAVAEDDATACARTKVWEARQQGWNLRGIQSTTLTPGQLRAWPVATAPGLTYRFVSCAERGVADLDLLLVDGNGEILDQQSGGREPTLSHASDAARRVHLVLRSSRAIDVDPRHAAVAILFR